ncbi:dihydrofolate reductase [Domibacillus sp. PGB-M46]|uniref:dihydrofolate reductase n=1 Tax=Domibacillus sp. PGB-M46 TaxID=2910255 RepID=UPI001F5A08E8|nr:dihydrofolate reductase [Domibacillus sp. PGB-M46]MCI2254751.1 dihydrofolate reductase [Domibacillus sp. PGB-M46]
MISFIWAEAKGGVIGRDNDLPWRLPEDLRFFKRTTLGYPIVMGRKTFASFGSKPLPKRENIILTTERDFHQDGVTVVHSKEEVLQRAKNEDIFVIGGANVFKQFLPEADRLYVTKIEAEFEGDTVIDFIPWDEFKETSRTKGEKNEENPYDYFFCVYDRTTR